MIDISFLRELGRFDLVIRKRVTSSFIGERAAPFTGRGLIFKDYSIYTPGDDIRRIDWKVFARTDKLFVRRFEEERNLTVHIIIDSSGSMDFGTRQFKKFEYASMLGLGFAHVALKENERFVLSTFSEGVELFKPKKGKKNLIAAYDYLNRKQPVGAASFPKSMAQYRKLIDSRSLVILVSDFLYPLDQIKTAIYQFKEHEVKVVQVLDPLEKELNIEGDFKLSDVETKQQLRTYVSPSFRKKYIDDLEAHTAAVQKACAEIGARFYSFSSGTPIFDSFYRMMSERVIA